MPGRSRGHPRHEQRVGTEPVRREEAVRGLAKTGMQEDDRRVVH